MIFYEDGKTYEVEPEKVSKTKVNHINKVGNRYLFYVFDRSRNRNHVFFGAKTLKDAVSIHIPYENPDYIEITLKNNFISTYSHSRNVFTRPAVRDIPIGEKCIFGNLQNCIILGKNNVSYYVKIADDPNNIKYDVVHWSHVVPVMKREYFENPRNNIRYYNTTISDLMHKMFYFGCDMNPDYQRGNVWTAEQEEKLIDSVFKQINIGAFIFAHKDWAKNHEIVDDMFEIVDGKQRLTAILHFIEGKIKYNGLYYHEMHNFNRNFFEDTQVLVGEIEFRNGIYNKQEILENFIRLNECGSSMNKDVIEHAKALKSCMSEKTN